MAKKKAASTAPSSTPAPKKIATKKANSKKADSKKAPAKAASNGAATNSATAIDTEQIGLAAGAVWTYLNDKGATSLTSLKKGVGAPTDLTIAAVGWLAREEKLEFTTSGKTVKLALK